MTWRPSASLEVLHSRARLLSSIRRFMAERQVLEVETPQVSRAATSDPNLRSLQVRADGELRYLHTSPELAMKRLLAAGMGSCYQICKAFREGEHGRLHNPEFTLLEWYLVGGDHHTAKAETSALIRAAFADAGRQLPLASSLGYGEAFQQTLGLDPHTADTASLASCAADHGLTVSGSMERDQWLDLLLSHRVVPTFANDRLTLLYDFPASQAALARVRDGHPPVAERFEAFWGPIELANGFHELTDGVEQRRRLQRELADRRARGLDPVPIDERFLDALSAGLPPCAGIALGVDRLLMVLTGAPSLSRVMAFDWSRA